MYIHIYIYICACVCVPTRIVEYYAHAIAVYIILKSTHVLTGLSELIVWHILSRRAKG